MEQRAQLTSVTNLFGQESCSAELISSFCTQDAAVSRRINTWLHLTDWRWNAAL